MNETANQGYQIETPESLKIYLKKLKTSANVWTVIGIYQLVVGIPLAFVGYGIITVILGIWNLKNAGKVNKVAEQFQKDPRGVCNYAQVQSSSPVMLIVNLVLGAGLGVIGSLVDISTASYGKEHINEFSVVDK